MRNTITGVVQDNINVFNKAMTCLIFAGVFLGFIAPQSYAATKVIPVNAVLDFSSGSGKTVMISTDTIVVGLKCDSTEASVFFIAKEGNAAVNVETSIIITPTELGRETSNQTDIFSTLLPSNLNELITAVIFESDDPGKGQMAAYGPGVITHKSGDAIILSSAQVTYNLIGDGICSYAGNISVVDN